MKLIRLYIEDFMCYDRGFIDFTQFSAALIVGKIDNNELYSNGVGKTTIFKAIEYVLFNQADVNLENIIRDDANSCRIVMDFVIGNQEYRISRSRTKKGTTDLSLLQRNAQDGDEVEVYHAIESSLEEINYKPFIDKNETEKYWKNISGSRASDTEKDLAKIIKITAKSFRSTVHFMQNDFAGLQTATPEKRKLILKDALNLIIYTKLEKLAKEKAAIIAKDIDKNKILIETLADPNKDLIELIGQLSIIDKNLTDKNDELNICNIELFGYNEAINELINTHANLENKFSSLVTKGQTISNEKSRLEISVKEYNSKKTNIIKSAQDIINEVKILKDNQAKLAEIDYSNIDILNEKINNIKEKVLQHNVNVQKNISAYEDLKIPVPNGDACKYCRQLLKEEHKKSCKLQISKDMKECQVNIQNSKNEISSFNIEIAKLQQSINDLSISKQHLEGLNTQITSKNKEIQDKRAMHDEYLELLEKFEIELKNKIKELEDVKEELKLSSIEEAKLLKIKIEEEKKKVTIINAKIGILNKEINHLTASKAVIQHNIDQKNKDKVKKQDLKNKLFELETKFEIYPTVIQAFSSTGIPNLIIQNVLDDLQLQSNKLLAQLKPGLQLSFFIEKINGDGDEADTLDIKYHINGKERYYEQLSGAMKLAVTFSLKLGLSFLLQEMIDMDIKFLLLDEIDQSLDKASVDAFADIVKFFQKDFIILIITHNDRLKDKFSHAILVEQDINMISRAKVVSSW